MRYASAPSALDILPPRSTRTPFVASITHLPGLRVEFESVDISKGTEFIIQNPRHTVIVHLDGRMKHLDTELEHHAGSRGPALPGEIWTVPAGRRYHCLTAGDKIGFGVLSLDPSARSTFLDLPEAAEDLSPLAGARDPFLHQTMRQLASAASATDDLSGMLREAIGHTIGLHLCKRYLSKPLTARGKNGAGCLLSAARTRNLRDFIHDNLSGEITLTQLAALTRQTTHQLLVSFRQSFGLSPWQYIIAQRLRCARRLLCTTRMDITAIALESGFSSHSHLTSSFRQHTGCSPREFRAGEAGRP